MNKQLVFGVIAVVLASTLVASLVVDSALAHTQRIHQHNHASQSSTIEQQVQVLQLLTLATMQ